MASSDAGLETDKPRSGRMASMMCRWLVRGSGRARRGLKDGPNNGPAGVLLLPRLTACRLRWLL